MKTVGLVCCVCVVGLALLETGIAGVVLHLLVREQSMLDSYRFCSGERLMFCNKLVEGILRLLLIGMAKNNNSFPIPEFMDKV